MSKQKDYINIADKDYRVEFNWNSTASFLKSKGMKLQDMDKLNELDPTDVTGLIYHGVKEGCQLDGIEFPYTEHEFGAMLQPKDVADLLMVYQAHTQSKQLQVAKKK